MFTSSRHRFVCPPCSPPSPSPRSKRQRLSLQARMETINISNNNNSHSRKRKHASPILAELPLSFDSSLSFAMADDLHLSKLNINKQENKNTLSHKHGRQPSENNDERPQRRVTRFSSGASDFSAQRRGMKFSPPVMNEQEQQNKQMETEMETDHNGQSERNDSENRPSNPVSRTSVKWRPLVGPLSERFIAQQRDVAQKREKNIKEKRETQTRAAEQAKKEVAADKHPASSAPSIPVTIPAPVSVPVVPDSSSIGVHTRSASKRISSSPDLAARIVARVSELRDAAATEIDAQRERGDFKPKVELRIAKLAANKGAQQLVQMFAPSLIEGQGACDQRGDVKRLLRRAMAHFHPDRHHSHSHSHSHAAQSATERLRDLIKAECLFDLFRKIFVAAANRDFAVHNESAPSPPMMSEPTIEEIHDHAATLAAMPASESEPFSSLYKARAYLVELLPRLSGQSRALVNILIGVNHIEAEELSSGVTLVESGLALDPSVLSICGLTILLSGHHGVAVVWANRGEHRKALGHLKQAQEINRQMRRYKDQLHVLHTRTLFILAQVYGSLHFATLSALYCHLCLRRQAADRQAIDKQEFVKNTIGLSMYYTGRQRFSAAFHCLEAARSFISPSLWLAEAAPRHADLGKQYNEAADVARGFAGFYLKYMQVSAAAYDNASNPMAGHLSVRLRLSEDDDDEEGKDEKVEEHDKQILFQELKEADVDLPSDGELASVRIIFSSLDLPAPVEFPLIADAATAVSVFKTGQGWFNRAMNFYILDGFVSDHVPLAQDLSQLFKCLCAYETDRVRYCKLEKRRIDLLTPIAQQLSQAAYLEFFQQTVDELGACYSNLCEAKNRGLSELPAAKQPQAQAKINTLALKAVGYYQQWIATWFDGAGKLKFAELNSDVQYQRWFFLANFAIARLFSRVFHSDGSVLNQSLKKALEYYNKCVTLSKEWPDIAVPLKEEIHIATEMVSLLPVKMDKIVAHGAFK